MRIISKFHDYYDTAMAFGHDPSVVYVRHLSFVENKNDVSKYAQFEPMLEGSRSVEKRNKKFHATLRSFTVAFCGKTYNGIWVSMDKVNPGLCDTFITDDFFYDYDTLTAHLTKYGLKLEDSIMRYRWMRSAVGRTQAERYNSFLNSQGSTTNEDFLINNKIVTMIYSYSTAMHDRLAGTWSTEDRYPCIAINPQLKKIEFFKVMDPFKTFQEIDMYIGGVLPRPGAMMVNIEDKYRIPQHGFDKWSFRKQSEKKYG